MTVSQELKNEFHKTSTHQNLFISFPNIGLTIEHEAIYQESLRLVESILEQNSIEFVGCIASLFSVQILDFTHDLKDQHMTVSISTDNYPNEPITLFNGVVDSAVMQGNKRSKKITAYDRLYTKGLIDVSSWYKGLTFPSSLKTIRDSLFEYIGIAQELVSLPNDNLVINKQYDPQNLRALNVIKSICQINGAFGIMNRQDKFEYRILQNLSDTSLFPAVTLYPAGNLFPIGSAGNIRGITKKPEAFGFYRSVEYEEYEVKPVDKLTIRQTEDSTGVSYGSGQNNYIIQGNMFTYGLDNSTLTTVASRIYTNVQGIYYHPFEAENNGLPYIECGLDTVSYTMYDFVQPDTPTTRNFYVFSRELTGIQALKDVYRASGQEYQTEFITDLQTQIDTLKQSTKEDIKTEVASQVSNYDYSSAIGDYLTENPVDTLKVESVTELPTDAADHPNTIYLIQGEVTVN